MKECMKIRAHHGMCLAFFEGKGYSEEFTGHMQTVLDMLQYNPRVQIIAGGDIVCSKCPNLQEGICCTADLVGKFDRQVLAECGIAENAELDWDDFSKLVEKEILVKGRREAICGSCQWAEICRSKENVMFGGEAV